MLRRRSRSTEASSPAQLDPATLGARALLARWPLHASFDPLFGQTPHLLLAGLAAPAWAYLDQALQILTYGQALPAVTLLCADAAATATTLHTRYPHAAQVVSLRCASLTAPPPLTDAPPVTLVLVCLDDPAAAWTQAQQLAAQITQAQQISPLILVELGEHATADCAPRWDGQVLAVSAAQTAQHAAARRARLSDDIARTIHEHYRDTFEALGGDPETTSALQAWASLPDTYRQASRHQADHLWAKLALIDCLAVPDDEVEAFAFSSLEVERLAVIEHQRWAAERYLDGWTYAPERNNALKQHPDLIPYAALNEAGKDKDRFAVRHLTHLLAQSQLGIKRLLIIALDDAPDMTLTAADAHHLAQTLFARLTARYPDRVLGIASTLRDPVARQVVQIGLEQAQARLFWLVPEVMNPPLTHQTWLALAACAERRIVLNGEAERHRWFATRAEIGVYLGAAPPEVAPTKQVIRDPLSGQLRWNFDY
ncbi:RyR domain-containing protein [Allochromatium warmingii]|uniref:RyR domain-containing protein n=1 Tax=Allochromatium warmingii TaxID=61595 RepID=A0A1H3FRK6_ALLWA|nr:RyR domain-containing protein [Allochromatium warmingii]SDX93693.1 RyR domain-containing protein [Allochromatium warmingii]